MQVDIPPALAGYRLDQALAHLLPDFTRTQLQAWLKAGRVEGAQGLLKASQRVLGDEQIRIDIPAAEPGDWAAQNIPLDLLFEDEDLLVVNKPAGLVSHPAPGNREGTLLNAAIHHAPACALLPRGGIVHRLDKDTSGLMVVAKTELARQSLIEQLAAREVTREYLALVVGALTAGGRVELPVGRHPVDRKRMAVVGGGKPAITHYRVAERFTRHTLVRVRLETGRTHQIRVHMAHIRHPLVGDPVYGGRQGVPAGLNIEQQQVWQSFHRQALHAARLELIHPRSGEHLQWQVPMPADMAQMLELLRQASVKSAHD